MKLLMTGNEAVARGAFEAGVGLVSGYPGAPCTEALENVVNKYKEIYCEWSTNEKVAFEVAIGASFAGYRSVALMKTVGLNVAADPFMMTVGSQINGGLVLVVADDVGRILGDDYNDCRFYGVHAGVPVLEPSDSEEAKEYLKLAFEISEEFSTPVILRLTSVTCRTRSLVQVDENYTFEPRKNKKYDYSYAKTIFTSIMMGCKNTSSILEKYSNDFTGTFKVLEEKCNEFNINSLELNDRNIGVITAGVTYSYVKEVLPEASILKLGLINPLPKELIYKIANYVGNLYVVEEGQNVLERNIKSIGVKVVGEELFPKFPDMARFTPDIIEEKLKQGVHKPKTVEDVPIKLPVNCAGCSHLFVHLILKKHKIKAAIDVSCGSIGLLPHVDIFRIARCMGSSIGIAHGYNVMSQESENFVAVIGDGGFWHTGISGMINLIYNSGNSTTIIVDNSCIAMTGGQGCPSSGFGINFNKENQLDIADICKALGVRNIRTVDPYKFEELESSILDAAKCEGNAVVIVKRECITTFKTKRLGQCYINQEKCSKCKLCLKIGCLAIERKSKNCCEEIKINGDLCMGCRLCTEVCLKGATH